MVKTRYVAGALLLLLASTPAFAGFEFKGAASPSPEMQAPAVTREAMAPVPVTREEIAPPMKVAGKTSAEKVKIPAEETVSGFGKDLPLAIALQQVVPAGYQFSFGDGVNPGAPVSWTGGKPWQQVLADMLAAKNFSFSLKNSVVAVTAAAPEMDDTAREAMAEDMATPVVQATEPTKVVQATEPIMIRPDGFSLKKTPVKKAEAEKEFMPLPPLPLTEKPLPLREVKEMPVHAVAEMPFLKEESLREEPAADFSWKPSFGGSSWSVTRGDTLRSALKKWSQKSGTEIYWSIDYDYRLNSDATFSGSFAEAVGKLLERFQDTRPQPYGKLHRSAGGGKVLVIESYDVPR